MPRSTPFFRTRRGDTGVADRPDPFELIFRSFRAEGFPAIRAEIGDDRSLSGFLMHRSALDLMQGMRPDAGFGEGVDDVAALVHAAFWYWADGEQRVAVDRAATDALCAARAAVGRAPDAAKYIQIAPRRVWAALDSDAPYEPLDGWFAVPAGEALRAVACFGVHPDRPGVSVAVVEGLASVSPAREDGSRLFSPRMPGGDAAGLHGIESQEELLLLAWRAEALEEKA